MQAQLQSAELEGFQVIAACMQHQPAELVKMQQCAAWALFLLCCGSLESRKLLHQIASGLRQTLAVQGNSTDRTSSAMSAMKS
jgi:hypothetical protein